MSSFREWDIYEVIDDDVTECDGEWEYGYATVAYRRPVREEWKADGDSASA